PESEAQNLRRRHLSTLSAIPTTFQEISEIALKGPEKRRAITPNRAISPTLFGLGRAVRTVLLVVIGDELIDADDARRIAPRVARVAVPFAAFVLDGAAQPVHGEIGQRVGPGVRADLLD